MLCLKGSHYAPGSKLMFYNNSHEYNAYFVFQKIYLNVAFNDIHDKQKIFQVKHKSTKK